MISQFMKFMGVTKAVCFFFSGLGLAVTNPAVFGAIDRSEPGVQGFLTLWEFAETAFCLFVCFAVAVSLLAGGWSSVCDGLHNIGA